MIQMTTAAVAPARESGKLAPVYLRCEGVEKMFGSVAALSDIHLDVGEGEFVSFLGPSGCGKTTLLRAIAGLDPPTAGRVTQAGRDITGLPPSQRDFGIVFQSYALFPNLSVTANVGYGLRGPAWPKPRMEERVCELLHLVGLSEHARKYPSQLSGGQQQRVALARALANEPGLLLLDEPLSALDAIVRLHLRGELRSLQRRLGVTTIMVTHDQEEAMAVSDRIVVMSRGRIEQVGRPNEIYRRPASAFVAGFVGHSQAFDATAEDGEAIRTADGASIRATAAGPMPRGQPLRVFVRPEDVRLGDAARDTPHGFEATITSLGFIGAVCRVSLEAGTLRLEADLPTDTASQAGWHEGTRVPAAIAPDRVLVFPAA
jgi:iron(III) transport system ATP-binding protein